MTNTQHKKNLHILLDTMYNMFSYDNFPHLEMDDLKIMWEPLIKKLEIHISTEDWDNFIEDINCKAADKYNYFEDIFFKYFH